MLILPEQKSVFISIPKTAGTSIHYSLNSVGYKHPEPKLYHMSAREFMEQNLDKIDYFKFAFVRNPFDRLVSVWNDFKYKRKRQYSERIVLDKPLLHEYNTFDEFVLDLPNSWYFKDVHVRPQWTFTHCCQLNKYHNAETVYPYFEKIVQDVGKFENLEQDFDRIVQQRGLKLVKPLTVNNSTSHQHYSEYYTDPRVVATVIKMYIQDFQLFNYSYEVGQFEPFCSNLVEENYSFGIKCKNMRGRYMDSFNYFERRKDGCEF